MSGSRRDVVIVGGGPAGLAAAEAYRDRGGAGRISLLTADPDPPYERPALSKEYLRGEIDAAELPMRDTDFYRDNGIEIVTGCRVGSLDAAGRAVVPEGGEPIAYESCVLATGARPATPPVPIPADAGVLTLRSRSDSERVARAGRGRVLVVGSGFIGCEAAASLAMNGADVILATVERSPQIDRLGPEVGEIIASWLRELGVDLRTGAPLLKIDCSRQPRAEVGDQWIVPNAILLALGIEPRVELAEGAGVELVEGRIPVDARMRTTVGGLLACGDVCIAENEAAGRRLRVEHWGEALAQGGVAGAVLAGAEDESWDSAPGFWSTIGHRTLKYVAWGDGFDDVRIEHRGDGGFVATYGRDGRVVGVLTHDADDAYEAGRELVESGAEW